MRACAGTTCTDGPHGCGLHRRAHRARRAPRHVQSQHPAGKPVVVSPSPTDRPCPLQPHQRRRTTPLSSWAAQLPTQRPAQPPAASSPLNGHPGIPFHPHQPFPRATTLSTLQHSCTEDTACGCGGLRQRQQQAQHPRVGPGWRHPPATTRSPCAAHHHCGASGHHRCVRPSHSIHAPLPSP